MIYTTKDIDRVVYLAVIESLTQNEISRETGINKGTIREWLDRAGIEPSKHFGKQLSDDVKIRVCFLYDSFYSTTEISIIMSMSKKLVRSTLLRCGKKLRSRQESTSLFHKRMEIFKQRELRRLSVFAIIGDDEAIENHINGLYKTKPVANELLTKEQFEISELARLFE
ncbi:hypothetical protein KAR91_43560 [Candidatus Pacearchaeota archaeon]|nr:hypothetical protein [Candidatus Pacearchaeota archaeon]